MKRLKGPPTRLHRPPRPLPGRCARAAGCGGKSSAGDSNGTIDGKPFHTETTLLPYTRTIEWTPGQNVENLISQYSAFLDGRLQEVALDYYAQADDGSVWYFGEDVYDYNEQGLVAYTTDSWLAGRDGPPAMIMPGDPKVGQAFRTENIPGVVFEEVTVKTVGKTEPGPPPPQLADVSGGADHAFDTVRSNDWRAATGSLRKITDGWRGFQASAQVPPRLAPPMSTAIEELSGAVRTRNADRASNAALDVSQAALDLELRYRPPAEIDRARFELWARQLIVDAAAGDAGGVSGDLATMEWVRDRFTKSVPAVEMTKIDAAILAMREAMIDKDLGAAGKEAADLLGACC